MKKKLSILVAMFFVFAMNAQTFGFKAGMTKSGYKVNFNVPEGANMNEGFHIAALAEIPLKETMNVRLTLMFNKLGSERYLEKEQNFGAGPVMTVMDFKKEVNYLQFSVTPKFKFGNAYAFIGPYAGFAISGVFSGDYKAGDTVLFEADDIDIFGSNVEAGEMDDYYKKFDFGTNLGFGYNFNNFFAELSAGMGLLNFINTDSKYYSMEDEMDPDDPTKPMSEDLSQRNVFFGLSIGYMFEPGK